MIHRLSPFLLVAVLSTGCATLTPKVQYQGFGEADPERDDRLAKELRAAVVEQRAPPPGLEPKVMVDTLPKGIRPMTGGSGIELEAGSPYRILGQFSLHPQVGVHYFVSGFFDYAQGWRKALCWPQVPLQWLTLGFWSVVPTDYPCHPSVSGMRPKAEVIRDVKALAAAAGADVVLMGYAVTYDDEANGAVGWLLKTEASRNAPADVTGVSPASVRAPRPPPWRIDG